MYEANIIVTLTKYDTFILHYFFLQNKRNIPKYVPITVYVHEYLCNDTSAKLSINKADHIYLHMVDNSCHMKH